MGLKLDLGRASVAATLFCASIATAQSSPLADPACAAAHFLVGEWEVNSGDGELLSEVLWELGPEGCYLVETWKGIAEGNVDVFAIMAYNIEQKDWRYFAASTRPGPETWWAENPSWRAQRTLFVAGKMVGNELRFVTKEPLAKGTTAHFSFFNLPDGRIRELSLLSSDGGQTWETEYDLIWTRKK